MDGNSKAIVSDSVLLDNRRCVPHAKGAKGKRIGELRVGDGRDNKQGDGKVRERDEGRGWRGRGRRM
eukprot:755217-Hanusia_phi.AAC.3